MTLLTIALLTGGYVLWWVSHGLGLAIMLTGVVGAVSLGVVTILGARTSGDEAALGEAYDQQSRLMRDAAISVESGGIFGGDGGGGDGGGGS